MACLMVLSESPGEQDREKVSCRPWTRPPSRYRRPGVPRPSRSCRRRKMTSNWWPWSRRLRRLGDDKMEWALRERIVKLLERNNRKKVRLRVRAGGLHAPTGFRSKNGPTGSCRIVPRRPPANWGATAPTLASLKERLTAIAWDKGDIERGRKLYAARGCAQCHSAGSGLGPRLARRRRKILAR